MEDNRKFLLHFDREIYLKVVPKSDQEKKLPMPSFQKEYPVDAVLID